MAARGTRGAAILSAVGNQLVHAQAHIDTHPFVVSTSADGTHFVRNTVLWSEMLYCGNLTKIVGFLSSLAWIRLSHSLFTALADLLTRVYISGSFTIYVLL